MTFSTHPSAPPLVASPGAGFADPARDSQGVFRAVLSALSHPGRAVPLACTAGVPEGVGREAACVLLALLDAETTLWLSPRLQTSPVGAWLRFHTGCVLVASPQQAQFAWVDPADPLPALDALNLGTDAHPETATTLLLDGPAAPTAPGGWLLSGPGLREPQPLSLADSGPGRSQSLMNLHQAAAALFPRGLDVLLTAPGEVRGLPRTTTVQPLTR